jgi:hypothetical protein
MDVSFADLVEFTKGGWDDIPIAERFKVRQACERYCEERARQRKKEAHRDAWERLCPPEYRNTIYEELPNVAKFE